MSKKATASMRRRLRSAVQDWKHIDILRNACARRAVAEQARHWSCPLPLAVEQLQPVAVELSPATGGNNARLECAMPHEHASAMPRTAMAPTFQQRTDV
mmetsp:Transcript_29647/g.78563  ORF Transcript_29647/g.78563 Transcript_29647/m.78563 type:complete len:99 (-) Transcript_29647:170-466(-)